MYLCQASVIWKGISVVEVHKKVGKFVVAVCDRGYRSFRYRVVLIQLYSLEV